MKELEELLDDEETEVKIHAMQSFVELMDVVDAEYRKTRVRPRFQALFHQSGNTLLVPLLESLPVIVTCFGGEAMDDDDQATVYGFFKRAVTSSDSSIRTLCASSFAAVIKAAGARKYALHFHSSFSALCEDSVPEIRALIARDLSEMCAFLGKERSSQYMKEAFLKFLQDPSPLVARAVTNKLEATLSSFAVVNEEQRVCCGLPGVPFAFVCLRCLCADFVCRCCVVLLCSCGN